jgi:hypothetical protein
MKDAALGASAGAAGLVGGNTAARLRASIAGKNLEQFMVKDGGSVRTVERVDAMKSPAESMVGRV